MFKNYVSGTNTKHVYFASNHKADLFLKSKHVNSFMTHKNISLNIFITFTYIIFSNIGAKLIVLTLENEGMEVKICLLRTLLSQLFSKIQIRDIRMGNLI